MILSIESDRRKVAMRFSLAGRQIAEASARVSLKVGRYVFVTTFLARVTLSGEINERLRAITQ
jgi:hypothetical protein